MTVAKGAEATRGEVTDEAAVVAVEAEVVEAVVDPGLTHTPLSTTGSEESRVQKRRVSWNEGHHIICIRTLDHQTKCNNRLIPMPPPHMTRNG